MATCNTNVQVRLAFYARWLLLVATVLARLHVRVPHRWVVAVVNKSWRMRFGNGPWVRARMDARGRLTC
jgi:hypothetical protein